MEDNKFTFITESSSEKDNFLNKLGYGNIIIKDGTVKIIVNCNCDKKGDCPDNN